MNNKTKTQLENVNTAIDLLTEELSRLDYCVMKSEKDAPEEVQRDLHSIVSMLFVNDKAQDYIKKLMVVTA